jgi:hypothetical protein|tara:strand:- start:249 stop:434 length:186 start_codon:yes stop_codon:yes gene_type:complete
LAQRKGKRKRVGQELNRLAINSFHNGANFGGGIDTGYKGINGVKNKIDRAKIKIDFELTNL